MRPEWMKTDYPLLRLRGLVSAAICFTSLLVLVGSVSSVTPSLGVVSVIGGGGWGPHRNHKEYIGYLGRSYQIRAPDATGEWTTTKYEETWNYADLPEGYVPLVAASHVCFALIVLSFLVSLAIGSISFMRARSVNKNDRPSKPDMTTRCLAISGCIASVIATLITGILQWRITYETKYGVGGHTGFFFLGFGTVLWMLQTCLAHSFVSSKGLADASPFSGSSLPTSGAGGVANAACPAPVVVVGAQVVGVSAAPNVPHFCPNCGSASGGKSFCGNCGTKLTV